MNQHVRWLCHACGREWTFARREVPLTDDNQCPICLSTDIERVTYTPPFLGGDISRPGSEVVVPAGANTGEDVTQFPEKQPVFVAPNLTIAATEDDVYGVPV